MDETPNKTGSGYGAVTGCVVGTIALILAAGVIAAAVSFWLFIVLLPVPLGLAYIAFEMITGRKRISDFLFPDKGE